MNAQTAQVQLAFPHLHWLVILKLTCISEGLRNVEIHGTQCSRGEEVTGYTDGWECGENCTELYKKTFGRLGKKIS